MEAVLAKLLAALPASGDKTTYPEFIETLSYEETLKMPRAMALGKSQGVVKSYIKWDKETKTSSHVLERV